MKSWFLLLKGLVLSPQMRKEVGEKDVTSHVNAEKHFGINEVRPEKNLKFSALGKIHPCPVAEKT